MSDEPDDLEGDLRAAFAADQPAAETAPAVQSTAPDDGAPVRDEHGRFAPKADKTDRLDSEANAPQSQAQGVTEAAKPILPPASWSPTAKADFATLPPHIQTEVLKREKDIGDGLAQFQPKSERLNKIDAMLEPIRDRLRISGLTDDQYLGNIVQAEVALRGPRAAEAFVYLAQQYGIAPQAIMAHLNGGQQFQGQQQAYAPQPVDPALQQRLDQLEQKLGSREQADAQAAEAEVQGQIQAFANDPAHLYFHNVAEDMGDLIRRGRATTLEQAYDMACHADPTIRALIGKTAAPAKGSPNGKTIAGSPGQTAKANGKADSTASIEDDVRQAMEQLSGRV